jgi:hypothetical protein
MGHTLMGDVNTSNRDVGRIMQILMRQESVMEAARRTPSAEEDDGLSLEEAAIVFSAVAECLAQSVLKFVRIPHG